MNGLLAAIFWTSTLVNGEILSLDGVTSNPLSEFYSVGYGRLDFQKEDIGQELQYIKSHAMSYGTLGSISSLSFTDDGGFWVGHGFYNELTAYNKATIGFSFVPGVYVKGREVDLGGWLMFRSGIEFVFPLSKKKSISFSYDHRSSGDIWPFNPGLETWHVRFRTAL